MVNLTLLFIAFALAVGIAIPTTVFAVQIFVAATGRQRSFPLVLRRPTIGVIVPAHNEERGLTESLRSILRQLETADRVVVVADNCSDRTAEVALAAGAEVTVRSDLNRRGKGFALDYGLRFLIQTGSPEVVVIVDADCRLEAGALSRIAGLASSSGRPVQAAYLMAPSLSGRFSPIRNLAWHTKNYVRPLGWSILGLPCQLTGSGMAFPMPLLQSVELASGELVEDLALGLELAERGQAPLFCPDAVVTSEFPGDAGAESAQRTRWEHGYLRVMLMKSSFLLRDAIREGSLDLFGLALDLIVPPLSLLAMLGLLSLVVSTALFAGTGATAPMIVSLGSTMIFGIAVLILWHRFGRHLCSGQDLLRTPFYIFAKIPLYLKFLVNRQRTWIRTGRDSK